MAFKAESDDIRSSLSYKLQAHPAVQGPRGALHRSLRHRSTPTSSRSSRVLAEADLLVIGAPHRALPRPAVRRGPGGRHLEPRSATGDRRRWTVAGASRWSSPRRTARRGRGHRPACLDRILECGHAAAARSWSSYDSPDDTTVPVARRSTPAGPPRVRAARQHLRPGPGERHPLRHRPRPAPVVVVTMADGSDDPRQIDDAHPARRAGRGGGRGVALHARRPAGRRPVPQAGCCRAPPGDRSTGSPGSAPATPPTRFKAYRPRFVREVGIDSRQRLRDRPRADRQGPPPAACPVAEIPTIWLDRTLGDSQLQALGLAAASTCAGTASPSVGRSPRRDRRGPRMQPDHRRGSP